VPVAKLVAFPCNGGGFCPSCTEPRAGDRALHRRSLALGGTLGCVKTILALAVVCCACGGSQSPGPPRPGEFAPPPWTAGVIATARTPGCVSPWAGSIYFCDGDGLVSRIASSGGPVTPLIKPVQRPIAIASTADAFWFLDLRPGHTVVIDHAAPDGTIVSQTFAGLGDHSVLGPKIDGDRIYWSVSRISPPGALIRSMALAGGDVRDDLARPAYMSSFDVSGGALYWIEEGSIGIEQTAFRGRVGETTADPIMTGNGFILGPIRAVPDALLIGYTATRAAVPIAQGTERRLLHVPLSGGASTMLDAVVGDNGIGDIHVEGDGAYWWDDAGAYRTTLSTGATAVLTEGHPPPDGYVYRSYVASGGAVHYAATHATSTLLPGSVGRLGDSGPLATNLRWPVLLGVDASWLYWTEGVPGSYPAQPIVRVPIAGGAARKFVNSIADEPFAIAPTAAGLLVSDNEKVKLLPAGGGPMQDVLETGNSEAVVSIAADATSVYALDGFGVIWRAGFDGSDRRVLNTPVTNRFSEGVALAVADGYVYWLQRNALARVASDGSSQSVLAAEVTFGTGMALDGGIIAWSDAHSVYTLPVTGGTPCAIASQPSLTGPVAVSGGWVYWTSQIEIERAHVDGTGTQMLVNFPTYGGPNSLFATPSSVVWTDGAFQAVLGAVASQ